MYILNDPPAQALARLMLGYAPKGHRLRQNLTWLLDDRLAAVLRTVREPSIVAIRLAWWRDALVAQDLAKGRGEPLIEAWRASGTDGGTRAAIDQMIDGWSALIGAEKLTKEDLLNYAQGRGGGLFYLLGGDQTEGQSDHSCGAVWALWDLAAHMGNAEEAAMCLLVAQALLASADASAPHAPLPLRLMYHAARGDVQRQRIPKGGFRFRHYLAVLRASVLKRTP